jgi:hypothetical protein
MMLVNAGAILISPGPSPQSAEKFCQAGEITVTIK